MFVSKNLVFVELHKTGGSHICQWLKKTIGGEQIGKHNRVDSKYSDRFIVGSVRNPWDWYVSLWAYGCSHRGSVYRQTTDSPNLRYYNKQLPQEMGYRYPQLTTTLRQYLHDLRKDRESWRLTYDNPNNAENFRRWLTMILSPSHALDLREGFGFSPVSKHAGLMTYRYMKLFTNIDDRLYSDNTLTAPADLDTIVKRGFLPDYCIKNEALEEGLIEAMMLAGYKLTDDQAKAIRESGKQKVNASLRKEASFYYDTRTAALVGDRERLIIDRHHYTPPAGVAE